MSSERVTKRREKSSETPAEALARIQAMGFGKNDVIVIQAFASAGIPPELIDPRHNVLTFRAWKGKGRRVAKGAKSIGVTVWIPMSGKQGAPAEDSSGEKKPRSNLRPKLTRLFHECQTVDEKSPKGARPEAWDNAALVREGTYEADAGDPPAPVSSGDPDAGDPPATVYEPEPEHNPATDPEFEPATVGTESRLPSSSYTPITQPAIDDNGRVQLKLADLHAGDDDCDCPLPGYVTNVDCPVHGEMTAQEIHDNR